MRPPPPRSTLFPYTTLYRSVDARAQLLGSAEPGDQVGFRHRVLLVDAERLAALLGQPRSEEHTSELQSRRVLVCRLLLEKKKKITKCNDRLCVQAGVASIGS